MNLVEDEFRDINDLTHAEMAGEEIDQVIRKKESVNEPTPTKVEPEVIKPKTRSSPKKTVKRKTVKKSKQPKTIIVEEETSGDKWLTIIVSAIAVLAIILGIYFIFTSVSETEEPSTVAAVVNGVPIYNTDVDTRMKIIQTTENPFVTRDEALNNTINQELLVQEAENLGFKVSDEEVLETLKKSLEAGGQSMESFESSLRENDLDSDAVLEFYKDNLLTFKLVNATVLNKVLITDEEVEEYYVDNSGSFEAPERVTVKHILIGFDGDSENDTLIKSQDIMDGLEDDNDNFCDLVEEWSDDLGSKDTCGEYTFSKQDLLVPEFLDAGFDMDVDEVRLVKTQFGYHIVWKTDALEEGTQSFDDVKDSIVAILEREVTLQEYSDLVDRLREDAIIEIYTAAGEEVPEQPLIDEEEAEDEPAAMVEISEEEPEAEEEESEAEEEAVEEEPEVTVAETPRVDVVATEKAIAKNFAECVDDSGAVMYTVFWAPDNEAQLNVFGEDSDLIEVVECDASVEGNEADECSEFDFKAFPSWVIDDEVYQGLQSQMRLSTATGCKY